MLRPKNNKSFILVTVTVCVRLTWAQGGLPPANPGNAHPQAGLEPFPAAQLSAEAAPLTAQQLDDLVAPIALYPDELLSQVLAASTYPLEIVDAEQWMQQHKGMPAAQMVESAKQQSWDPSIQALVAFPDVLDILGHDIKWTTDLGNSFLAQQAEVMAAVQRMRARAQQSGQLQSTPQQTVTAQYQDGQSAIEIAPANPQVVYVPEYQPSAIWGPPAYGAYPSLWYPPDWGAYGGYGYGSGYGYGGGIGFSPGVFLSSLFSGLLNYGPWGWGLNWFSHGLFLIPSFFAHFFGGWWGGHGSGYGYYGGAVLAGHPLWVHDPEHRMGVPYMNRAVATRYGGSFGVRGGTFAGNRSAGVDRGFRGSARAEGPRAPAGGAWRGVGGAGVRSNAFAGESRGATRAPSANQFGARTPQNAGRSFGSNGGAQTFAGRNYGGQSYGGQGFSARPQTSRPQVSRQPQMSARNFGSQGAARQNFSAPSGRSSGSQHFSAPSPQHFSTPKNSGGAHFSGGGGHSGGHSGGGGGHSGGGHSGHR